MEISTFRPQQGAGACPTLTLDRCRVTLNTHPGPEQLSVRQTSKEASAAHFDRGSARDLWVDAEAV